MSDQKPSRAVGPEEGGHRVTSPSAADESKSGGGNVPEPPEYGQTIDALDDPVPSDVEPETERTKPA